jgi:WD40 repeat protein
VYVAGLTGHGSAVCGLSFSPNSRLLASGSNDETVRLWRERGRSSKFEDSATSRGLRRIAEALGLSASTASHYVARADRVRDEAMAVAAEIRGR